MRRAAFVEAALAAGAVLAFPRPAAATGGADIEAEGSPHTVRVLLASGPASAPPRPIDRWHFAWSGRTYRGTWARVELADGRPGLVNSLPLDAYLYGVVSAEVSPAWPGAAQRAQAIAARGYALAKLRPQQPYDVVAGQSDQRYAGIEAETVEGRQAVDSTSGRVVTYGGGLARVAYASCCGGHTADGALTWSLNLPYLRGVKDPYCAGTPAFRWSASIADGELARAFEVDAARSVTLWYPDASGRPQVVSVVGERTVNVKTPQFRLALGAARVRSTLISSATAGAGSVELVGTGFGHGVGLCQWGARVMGQVGASEEQILAFYFPGTQVGAA